MQSQFIHSLMVMIQFDGINDEFTFSSKAVSVAKFSCVIVNRWGVTIKEFTSISDSWDGTSPGGKKCPNGVYFYPYQGVAENGDTFSGQGNIQLISGE